MIHSRFLILFTTLFSIYAYRNDPMYDWKRAEFLRHFNPQNDELFIKTPELKSWVDGQQAKAKGFVQASPLYADLQKRNQELIPQLPPSVTQVPQGGLSIKAGSLVLSKIGGTELVLVAKSSLGVRSINDYRVSPDQSAVAYAVAKPGSDSLYWKVLNLKDGSLLDGSNVRTRIYPISWRGDSQGFFYGRPLSIEEEIQHSKNQLVRTKGPDVYYHRLQDLAENDSLIFENKFPSTQFQVDSTDDPHILVAHRIKSPGFFNPLQAYILTQSAQGNWDTKPLPSNIKSVGRFAGVVKNEALFISSEFSNHFSLVAYTLNDPKQAREFVRSPHGRIMCQVDRLGDYFVVQSFDQKFNNYLEIYNFQGELVNELDFQKMGLGLGGLLSYNLAANPRSSEMFINFSTTSRAPVLLKYQLKDHTYSIVESSNLKNFDSDRIERKIQWIFSTDRQRIPLTIYSRKDTPPQFAYIYFYGGNGSRAPDFFNRKFQLMLELKGLIAIVGARGGGEIGVKGYIDGMRNRLQSVDDVVIANRWLKSHYPNLQGRTIASGASYGGMITASLIANHANEFGAFTPTTLIADLEYFKTDYYGNLAWDDLGYQRALDGSILNTPEEKKRLIKFSAAAQLGKHPLSVPILSFTAENDERVSPHQTYLFTDMIQSLYPTNNSIFMIEYPGGHFARAESLDEAAFAAQVFGLTELAPLTKGP